MGKLALILLILPLYAQFVLSLKGKSLRPGDTVAFISPASSVQLAAENIEEYKENVTRAMGAFGLNVVFSPNAFAHGPSGLAGTDAQRAGDLMWAFQNLVVDGIIANRGGWGCMRIIDMLDYEVIQRNPKIIMGFSDLTSCLLAITAKTDLVTFHGPVGTDKWDNFNSVYMEKVLISGEKDTVFSNPPTIGLETLTIVPGKARGRLIGGTLTIIVAMLESGYLPAFDEPYILFLEDTHENTYKLDRMFTTLHLAGIFKNAQGLVWGTCMECPPDRPGHWTLVELIQQKWGPLTGVPSYMGAMIGHFGQQFTLPIGVQVEMDSVNGTITLLEAGVITNTTK